MSNQERLPAIPVILIHLEDPPDSGLAACCGRPYVDPEGTYPDVPRQFCPGCHLAIYKTGSSWLGDTF